MASLGLDDVLQNCGLNREQLNIPCPLQQRCELARQLESWEGLAPVIGLDETDVSTIQKNHRGDYRSQCSAALNTWEKLKGRRATYLSLAEGLVKQRNVSCTEKLCEIFAASAKPQTPRDVIKREQEAEEPESDGKMAGNSHPGVKIISTLPPAHSRDLTHILETNLDEVVASFAYYTSCVQESIQDMNIGAEKLYDFLVTFSTGDQRKALLPREKINKLKDKSVRDIFLFLKQECTSFLNYDIFERILHYFKVDRNSHEHLKYPQKLKAYVKKHTISEFIKIIPVLDEYNQYDEVTLTLVLKIDAISCKLDRLLDIVRSVAKIMNLQPSMLLIYDIKESCVEVTLLIPKSVADIIFTSDNIFSEFQQEEFRSLSVQLLKCNGYSFEFIHKRDQASLDKNVVFDKEVAKKAFLSPPSLCQKDCGIADSSQLPPLDATVAHLQEELAQKDVEIARLRMEKESERAHHQQEIEQIRATAKRELAQKDVEIARLCKKLLQRERACSAAKRETVASQVKSLDKEVSLELTWERGPDVPFAMTNYAQSVMVHGRLYMGGGVASLCSKKNFVVNYYNITSGKWGQLHKYEAQYFAMTAINNQLALVGGKHGGGGGGASRELGVWGADHKQWTYPYPAMRKARSGCSAVVHNEWLVVAGGKAENETLASVEVLNTDSRQWFAGPPTPKPFYCMKTAVVGKVGYFMGGTDGTHGSPSTNVYQVCIRTLIDDVISEASSSAAWKEIHTLQLIGTSPLSFNGSLFAMGGFDECHGKAVADIHLYEPKTGKWVKVGDMRFPRNYCTCAMITRNKMLVARGEDNSFHNKLKRMDFAVISTPHTLHHHSQ